MFPRNGWLRTYSQAAQQFVAEKSFSKIRVRESDKVKEIYLNDAELQALYEMPLKGLDAQVRDVFLVVTLVSDTATILHLQPITLPPL